MLNQQELNILNKLLKEHGKSLVGILCKRIELIESISKDKSSEELIKLYPELFKSLVKELVYENIRVLSHKINVEFIPTVCYKPRG